MAEDIAVNICSVVVCRRISSGFLLLLYPWLLNARWWLGNASQHVERHEKRLLPDSSVNLALIWEPAKVFSVWLYVTGTKCKISTKWNIFTYQKMKALFLKSICLSFLHLYFRLILSGAKSIWSSTLFSSLLWVVGYLSLTVRHNLKFRATTKIEKNVFAESSYHPASVISSLSAK